MRWQFEARQGHDVLIRAIAEALERIDLQLVCIGGGRGGTLGNTTSEVSEGIEAGRSG